MESVVTPRFQMEQSIITHKAKNPVIETNEDEETILKKSESLYRERKRFNHVLVLPLPLPVILKRPLAAKVKTAQPAVAQPNKNKLIHLL